MLLPMTPETPAAKAPFTAAETTTDSAAEVPLTFAGVVAILVTFALAVALWGWGLHLVAGFCGAMLLP